MLYTLYWGAKGNKIGPAFFTKEACVLAVPGARRDVLLAFESNDDEGLRSHYVRALREGLFQGARNTLWLCQQFAIEHGHL